MKLRKVDGTHLSRRRFRLRESQLLIETGGGSGCCSAPGATGSHDVTGVQDGSLASNPLGFTVLTKREPVIIVAEEVEARQLWVAALQATADHVQAAERLREEREAEERRLQAEREAQERRQREEREAEERRLAAEAAERRRAAEAEERRLVAEAEERRQKEERQAEERRLVAEAEERRQREQREAEERRLRKEREAAERRQREERKAE